MASAQDLATDKKKTHVRIDDKDSGDHKRVKSSVRHHANRGILVPRLVAIENDGPNEIYVVEHKNFVACELRITGHDGKVHVLKLDEATELALTLKKPKPFDKKVAQQVAQSLNGAAKVVTDAFSSLQNLFKSDPLPNPPAKK